MESFFLLCILGVLVICWIYLRNRLDELENRLFGLERALAAADRRAFAAQVAAPPLPPQSPMPAPPPEPAPLESSRSGCRCGAWRSWSAFSCRLCIRVTGHGGRGPASRGDRKSTRLNS